MNFERKSLIEKLAKNYREADNELQIFCDTNPGFGACNLTQWGLSLARGRSNNEEIPEIGRKVGLALHTLNQEIERCVNLGDKITDVLKVTEKILQ